jgi:O-Antigen ligase
MTLLLFIPGFISLFLILRGRTDTAFLSVYLPCLLMLPDQYSVRIPHLPPVSTAGLALIPLGVVGIMRLVRSGSFALMDLLVALYTASIGLSEILHASVVNDGIFIAFDTFISIFLAYVAGRALIEPHLRLATVRRFVILVLLDGIPGVYEWRMGESLYGTFGQSVLGITLVTAGVQLRGAHGRMGTVFGGGEPAGIVFAMTFCLNAWLVQLRRVKDSVDLPKTLAKLEKYHVPGLLLVLYVVMTQSRGPLLALGAGYLILQIVRFKNTRMMTLVVAVLFVGGYMAASAYFASYVNIDPANRTEQQSSALYRVEMNKVYPEVAEKGGWTGYGTLGIPHVEGLESIDNHYLLVHLAWGKLAYYLFILIVWENVRVLLVRSWRAKAFQERSFVFSVLAAMAVLWITLLTVFQAGQLPQISFLLIGWMQATGQPQTRGFSFRQVFS